MSLPKRNRAVSCAATFVSALLFAACSGPDRPCETDADCEGDTCDVALGACTTNSGGGGGTCNCTELFDCQSDGGCDLKYGSILITQPTAAVASVEFTAEAQLNIKAGRVRNDPSTLAYSVRQSPGAATDPVVSSGTLALKPLGFGTYSGPVTLPAGSSGTYVLEVAAANQLIGRHTFVVDLQPPVLTVQLPTRDAGADTATTRFGDPQAGFDNAWRRDETITVTVRANEPLGNVVVELLGVEDAGSYVAPVLTALLDCDAGFCASGELKLWRVGMPAFRGTMAVRASAQDLAGNRGASASRELAVTRWKWAFDAGTAELSSAAIDSVGRVVFATGGEVFSVASNGAAAWRSTVGGSVGAPAIGAGDGGRDLTFVAAGTGTAVLYALNGADGGEVLRCSTTGDSNAAIALGNLDLGRGATSTAFHATSTTGGLLFLQPAAPNGVACDVVTAGVPAMQASTNPVVAGGNVFFATESSQLASYAAQTLRASFPVSLPFATSQTFAAFNGALLSSGYTNTETGGLSTLNQDGTGATSSLADAGRLEGLTVDGEGRTAVTSRTTSELLVVGDAGTVLRVGADAGFGHLLLAVDDSIYLAAADRQEVSAWRYPSLIRRWTLTGDIASSSGAPAIDCARRPNGFVTEGPGVLYVPGNNGTLYAIIVDSRGLDTRAKWPKWQRDPRNSGNADVPLAQFACDP